MKFLRNKETKIVLIIYKAHSHFVLIFVDYLRYWHSISTNAIIPKTVYYQVF